MKEEIDTKKKMSGDWEALKIEVIDLWGIDDWNFTNTMGNSPTKLINVFIPHQEL